MSPDPTIRSDYPNRTSASEIQRTNVRTDGPQRTRATTSYLTSPTCAGGAEDFDNELVSLNDVLTAGIFPTGERFPVTRTGQREPIPYHLRSAVWLRDKGICQKCAIRNAKPWELDHIVPWSAGGSDLSTNLRVLCEPCNQNRGNYDDATTFARRPVTWWCHRCYGDPDWTFYRIYETGGVACHRHRRSRYCNLERVTKWQADSGEDFHWFFRKRPVEELGRPVFCAHCNLPSVSEVLL